MKCPYRKIQNMAEDDLKITFTLKLYIVMLKKHFCKTELLLRPIQKLTD